MNNMNRTVTFTLDYFNAITKAVAGGRESDYYIIKSDSPDHLKTTISLYFSDNLNPHLTKDFSFPSWMGDAPRANAPWTQEEETLVMQWYEHHKYTIKRLAEITGRNESGIISRLEKHFPELKKIREDNRIRKDLEKELEILLGKAEVAIAKLRAM